jgi:hypothetical protein
MAHPEIPTAFWVMAPVVLVEFLETKVAGRILTGVLRVNGLRSKAHGGKASELCLLHSATRPLSSGSTRQFAEVAFE